MVVGTISAIAHGAAMPLMMIMFGNLIDLFVNQSGSDQSLDILLSNLTDPNSPSYPTFQNLTKDTISDNFGEILYV